MATPFFWWWCGNQLRVASPDLPQEFVVRSFFIFFFTQGTTHGFGFLHLFSLLLIQQTKTNSIEPQRK